jgi:hypothetical protein
MVDVMIQINSWNWFMDDKNDTLYEFIDAVDVWHVARPTWWWCVARDNKVRWCGERKWCLEVWQNKWKLTRKCHSEYPDKQNQNDLTYKWLSAMNNHINLDEFIYYWPISFLFQKNSRWNKRIQHSVVFYMWKDSNVVWCPSGVRLVSVWCPSGVRLVSIWCPSVCPCVRNSYLSKSAR